MAADQLDRSAMGNGRTGRGALFSRIDQIQGRSGRMDSTGSIAAAVLTLVTCGKAIESRRIAL